MPGDMTEPAPASKGSTPPSDAEVENALRALVNSKKTKISNYGDIDSLPEVDVRVMTDDESDIVKLREARERLRDLPDN